MLHSGVSAEWLYNSLLYSKILQNLYLSFIDIWKRDCLKYGDFYCLYSPTKMNISGRKSAGSRIVRSAQCQPLVTSSQHRCCERARVERAHVENQQRQHQHRLGLHGFLACWNLIDIIWCQPMIFTLVYFLVLQIPNTFENYIVEPQI